MACRGRVLGDIFPSLEMGLIVSSCCARSSRLLGRTLVIAAEDSCLSALSSKSCPGMQRAEWPRLRDVAVCWEFVFVSTLLLGGSGMHLLSRHCNIERRQQFHRFQWSLAFG